MSDAALEPIDRFHDEVKAIAATGISVNLGFDRDTGHIGPQLDRIRTALSIRDSLGQSVDEAIVQHVDLPARYRAAALAWVRFAAPSAVLESISISSQADRGIERRIHLAALQTAITVTLICAGLAIYTPWVSPRIDAVYAQIDAPRPQSVMLLSLMRAWLPLWASIAVIALLVAALLWYRSDGAWTARWARLLPMVRRREQLRRQALFADHLAIWLQHELPPQEGIRLAAALSLAPAAAEQLDTSAVLQPSSADTPVAPLGPLSQLPPLLNWALGADLAGEPRWLALRSVGDIYRQLADRQVELWAKSIPMFIAACVCGVAVMLYALGLFLPVTSLLQDVSTPGNR